MPSHFQCIGFPDAQHSIFEIMDQIFTTGSRQQTPRGDYVGWNVGQGAEGWLQLDGMNVLGFIPHFSGESHIRCQLTTELNREGQSPLDAALQGWVNPNEEGQGDYPIVFNSPDYHLRPLASFPQLHEVQLALFPEQISVFASEKAFADAQESRPQKYAAQSFVPTGLFGEAPHRPEVFACGIVKSIQPRTNSLTHAKFRSLVLTTFGGSYDIPMPDTDESRRIQTGNIIAGSFWVSGRILQGPPPLPV